MAKPKWQAQKAGVGAGRFLQVLSSYSCLEKLKSGGRQARPKKLSWCEIP